MSWRYIIVSYYESEMGIETIHTNFIKFAVFNQYETLGFQKKL